MSRFELGYKFSQTSGIDQDELVLQKRRVKYFTVDMKTLDASQQDECLVRIKDVLHSLYKESDWKTQKAARNAGFSSTDRTAYCQGAKVLIDCVVERSREKIASMEARQAVFAERSINRAEQEFERLSPYHSEILTNMRNRPN